MFAIVSLRLLWYISGDTPSTNIRDLFISIDQCMIYQTIKPLACTADQLYCRASQCMFAKV